MGYFYNHLATLVMGVFAAILSLLWVYFNGFAPILDFVFLMAVPISWFLVITLWLSQKSADYMHRYAPHTETTSTKQEVEVVVDADQNISETRVRLLDELESLRQDVRLKDDEITKLRNQIDSLQTRVQIESIRADMANLRELASRR